MLIFTTHYQKSYYPETLHLGFMLPSDKNGALAFANKCLMSKKDGLTNKTIIPTIKYCERPVMCLFYF